MTMPHCVLRKPRWREYPRLSTRWAEYDTGHGRQRNVLTAVQLYEKVLEADPNHSAAGYRLGVYYMEGDPQATLPKDKQKAIRYFRVAADRNHPDAKKLLNKLLL